MSFASPPSMPSYAQNAAQALPVGQLQSSENSTAAKASQEGSMVNQTNPYGSLNYQQTGTGPNGAPIYSANLSLSPEQQQLFNTLQGTKGTAGTQASSLLSGANYGATSPTDSIGDMTKGLTKDLLKTQTDYYQPFFTTQRDQLDTKLKNQGLHPGMPAYDNALRSLDTSQNLAVTKAAGDFEPQAFNQASSLYGMPAALAQQLAQFGAPGDPKAGLVNAPGLNIQPANYIGAVGGAESYASDKNKSDMANYQNMMSGMWGIPSAVLGGWAKGGFPGASSLGSMFGGTAAAGATGGEAALGAEALGLAMI